ncbi:MAG TPA: prepilin-type N-terminal cleavage/methylation domain-containing protein [Phycisphaerae bacterium]|nr:prepilin-type N-terminal cleavage/methylation domain-containing protein [Phycisphaerae bacterium]
MRIRRAFTLVELLLALAIIAVTSTAVVAMLSAAARTSSVINAEASTEWELDAALRRITQEVRTCAAGSLVVSTDASGNATFSLVTQPDVNNNAYNVSYALATAADGTRQVVETDPRYGTSVLVHNVQTWDAHLKNLTGPAILVVSVTAGRADAQTSRVFEAAPRN